MGDYEVYCALCGFILHDLYLEDASYDYRRSQLPAGEEEPPWLNEMQVMGENLDAPTLKKVYVSGPQTACAVGNSFDVDPGQDPRFPARGQVRYVEDGRADLCVYEWTVHGYTIPYHRACYHVLEKAVASYTGAPVDLEILYKTLRNLAASHPEIQAAKVLPGIDYGEAARAHRGGWWWPRQGYETFTWDPTDIPELRAYYAQMPMLYGSDSGSEGGEKPAVQRQTSEPFAGLPTNVLHSILHLLPISSVAHLRMASPAVAQTNLNNDFWASKLHHDMPWLYDLPTEPPISGHQLDWARIYQHLWLRSQEIFPFQMRGLVNRRRIWGICAQIAQPYATAKWSEGEQRRHPRPILDNLIASPMRPLRLPRVLAPQMAHLLLVDEMKEFNRPRPTLSVCWSSTGALAGFETRYIDSEGRETIETAGTTNCATARNEVHIATDDWIRGFIITSRVHTSGEHSSVIGLQVLFLHRDALHLGDTTGDKRLLHAEADRLLVGLTAQYDHTIGEITALSLLQAHPHLQDPTAHTLSNRQTRYPYAHTTITSKLWQTSLPPPTHLITERQPGFWPDGFDPHLEPMECLTLGITDSDLASITALSIDIYLGGIHVHYANQPPKSIGPRLAALKTLSIDGSSGERIAAVLVHGANNNGLTVLTNRNRQLIVGSRVGGKHYFVPGEDQNITGLYGAWRGSKMQWISTTFSHSTHLSENKPPTPIAATYSPPPTNHPMQPAQSETNIPWDISPPPTSWLPRGPIHGAHTWTSKYGGFENECPSPRTAFTTWLDCTRDEPLEKVRVVFAHPTRRLPFSPVGIGLFWADGVVDWVGVDITGVATATSTTTSISTGGSSSSSSSSTVTDDATADATPPPPNTNPSKTSNSNNISKCPCAADTESPLSPEALNQTPHFTEEEWIVSSSTDGRGGLYLHSVRLWTKTAETGTGPLLGFQFVCSGTGSIGEGPRWGVCEGCPAAVVWFGGSSSASSTSSDSDSDSTSKGRINEDENEDESREENETRAVGLKIFIDENDRPGVDDSSSVYSDPVMVCFQGLFGNH